MSSLAIASQPKRTRLGGYAYVPDAERDHRWGGRDGVAAGSPTRHGSRQSRRGQPDSPQTLRATARLAGRGNRVVYVNQVLFTIYILAIHGGDPSFIARYLPAVGSRSR